MPESTPIAPLLLDWYDRHRRDLPWRAKPHETADPYHVWLSEIMLQQTTVRAVIPYFHKFLSLWPRVDDLAAAPVEAVMSAWAGLGYYSRARNLHLCAKVVVSDHGGQFPADLQALRTLPGIGDYTSAAIAAIAFNLPAAVVDGNVERVMTRLHAVEDVMPAAKTVVKALTLPQVPQDRPGDFAQAMMDLGATICTPRSPACGLCPLMEPCSARKAGTMLLYPRKAAKKTGTLRQGVAFVVWRQDDCLLVRTRPTKGLLGGMSEVPGSAWSADFAMASALDHAPLAADYRRITPPVRHVFTHFPLDLTVFAARVPASTQAPQGMRFVPRKQLAQEAFPTVFVKAIEAAR